jgi:hypothetical protein
MGTGGGGFSGGSAMGINQPVAQGYAAGATDTGHEGMNGSFALDADGRLNWQLIRDNGHWGIHEMTVAGKALTEAMYGVAPRYSYFNGCSTGGRQGLMEAQRYPQDYDGIVSGAPAINWNRLHPQQLWGPVLMNSIRSMFVHSCTIMLCMPLRSADRAAAPHPSTGLNTKGRICLSETAITIRGAVETKTL